ncbi:MAG: UDP-N-acetylmuramate--L-alanine ligase [Chloroflexi bacterium]|nr:UDP-N-acetylmuramate--L-alanine ligase [Chloroflexi bacterium CFX1]MCK6567849.1 UDP-N-acetylmuramate--L-alanine ligase [Anaerolineales bacterium]MCQ3952762.1 UDP-N-acetylmuramate--L-alanine ligase [Chloroflexota bacterium]MDL1918429.1 UDP-N-acetylmuramate--L-alanine ligase [Chloroflexi bacterium CFX5]NUQ59527.1 UDP-N-acetylmuramate--L-alanine ligase [Anaerolineales bacterium]
MTRYHFIGIGGSGLSAIARLLKESGCEVTGSDQSLSPFAAELQNLGVKIFIGHHPRNISGAEAVIRSSAIKDDNPEVEAAKRAGIPVYKRADFLGQLMEKKTGIAVAGTHGKTTTTAMIAWMLTALDRDPSFIVGGALNNLKANAHAGRGETFVIEADEYDRMFLGLKPQIEVVTNLEHDHPDCFPTFNDMYSAFESFVNLLPPDGSLIACAEDEGAAMLVNHARRKGLSVVSYSLQGEMTIVSPQWTQARAAKPNERGGFDFSATTNMGGMARAFNVSLQVPGEHNVRNALAALSVAALLGLPMQKAAEALGQFTGTGRRFETRGEPKGVLLIDDYAHHPTEIRATLAAAKARYPERRIWAVWQPHTYSRTQTLLYDFSRAFNDADEVLVTEIYASREAKQDFSSAEVVGAMPHISARYSGSLAETKKYLLNHLRSNDVVIVLSAGDADGITNDLLKEL